MGIVVSLGYLVFCQRNGIVLLFVEIIMIMEHSLEFENQTFFYTVEQSKLVSVWEGGSVSFTTQTPAVLHT